MSTEVLVALISLVGVVISAVLSLSLTNWRLSQIEKRLDQHNSYAEKFAEATTDIALIRKDIEYLKEQK